MKKSNLLWAWVIVAMLCSLPVLAEESCEHDENTFRCVKFLSLYDADTVRVEIPNVHPYLGHNAPVRVNGLDTPEIKGKDSCEKKKALEAKAFVEDLLKKAKRIDLKNIGKEKYGRILADVVVDGVSLTKLLIQKQYAYEYHGGTKRNVDWCSYGKSKRLPASKESGGKK